MSGWAWLGVFAGLIGFLAILFSKALFPASWFVHALGLAALAGAVAVIRYGRNIPAERAFAAGVATVFLLGFALSVWSLYSVASSAKATAAGEPYCIQVTDSSQAGPYVPARSLLDLSGLTMWSRSGGLLHHAILLVGDASAPKLFHWSYRKQEFVPGTVKQRDDDSYGTALTCIPTQSFIASLPVFFSGGGDSQYIRFSPQEAFRIPYAYQPRWSGSAGGSLSFAATAPDFKPINLSWSSLSLRERIDRQIFIQWNPSWLSGLMGSAVAQVTGTATAFGLRTSVTVTQGRNGKTYESQTYRADADEQPGLNTTLITCYAASDITPVPSCQHRFLSGDRHFNFRHRPEDVAQWQAMQKRLTDLLDAFTVQKP
jgi:hypothetical protein